MSSISVRASPITGLPWVEVPRVLKIAAAVGVIESLAGVFALNDNPFIGRTIYVVALNLLSAVYGVLAYWAARHLSILKHSFWARVLAADLLTAVPGVLTLWVSTFLVGGHSGSVWTFIAYGLAFGLLLSGAFIAAFIAPGLDKAWECAVDAASTPAVIGQVSFTDRLPLRLRGADLWALKAEDHYLSVITSRGQALIRLRIADAERELHGTEGVRSHRSWWVARRAVADVKREDGRVRFLVLPDGRQIPVSRTGAQELTRAGWL